ncbi:Aldo-keto reductase AKR2E4 [Eumeta japonica]|uniref:Aldo-keto reductase AKR2E4 n=1 Tax=Eumeta variegata TaxID=151549 RepID=A0A4C1TWT9_EUMVA|nr:Aldo-keto reductase AKR2E4 [Eumeta japonica]
MTGRDKSRYTEESVVIPTIKLNNGMSMPVLGYGTWLGFNDQMEIDMPSYKKMVDALEYAIDIGYRHIDTAHLYRVEPEVGEVIEKKIKEGVVKREDLFITTKVWQHYHREKDVEVSVRDSLRRMKLDYVDQVLVHWPMSHNQEGVDEKIDYLETWRGFEAVLKAGLTKSIGVSNFSVAQLKRLIASSKVVPATNQVEGLLPLLSNIKCAYNRNTTPLARRDARSQRRTRQRNKGYRGRELSENLLPTTVNSFNKMFYHWNIRLKSGTNTRQVNLNFPQHELVDYCKSQGIVVVAYAPLGCLVPSKNFPNSPEPKLDNPQMVAMAKKHKKTVTQIVLRHLYERGLVSLPKTVTRSRVLENASIFDFKLDADDTKVLESFNNGYRSNPLLWYINFEHYPFEKVVSGAVSLLLGRTGRPSGKEIARSALSLARSAQAERHNESYFFVRKDNDPERLETRQFVSRRPIKTMDGGPANIHLS